MMYVENDFNAISVLATCIGKCQDTLICIFDENIVVPAFKTCSKQFKNFLYQQNLSPGVVLEITQDSHQEKSPTALFNEHTAPGHFISAVIPLTATDGLCFGALCLVNAEPVFLNNQQKEALLLLALQFTAQLFNTKSNVQLKQALAKAEKFNALFDQSTEIHCITDTEGKIEYISEAVYRLLGYSPADTLGKTIWDFCVPGERERLRPQIYAALGEGHDRFNVETRTLTKAGELRWFEWSDVVKEDHWLINGRDITARKQSELDARILSTAVEQASAAIFIRNTELQITWANPAAVQLLGYSLEELVGETFLSLFVGPEMDASVHAHAAKKLKKNEPYEIEIQFYKNDKSLVWLSVSTSFVFNLTGQVERIVSVAFDITQRKQVEAQLVKTSDDAVKLSRAKESFLSVMSHEMRTPLNAVIGMSRILSEEEHLAHQQEHLDILGFSAQNLLTLINDVLDFTKIETGNMMLESRPVNLEQLVHHTVQSLKPKAREQGIEFFYELTPELPVSVFADQTRLYQILMNLAGNAVKFTTTGYVKIGLELLEETASEVEISFAVSDTGIGITADKLEMIFDAYTQAGSDITRKYGGTGLGLAITKKLISLYNSHIEVESEPGQGTTFSFRIWFKKALADAVFTHPEKELPLTGHVLVVDDSSVNRLVAKKILQKWQLTTDFAENGFEALEKIKTNRYSLVLMDIHMPVMGGLEATKLVRSKTDPYYQQLPILALTGSTLEQEQQLIHNYGMNDCILKPFDTAELYRKIKSHIK
jgi:PAS domain S-box-containing protein